jgi:hypothetical protein
MTRIMLECAGMRRAIFIFGEEPFLFFFELAV